MTRGFLDGCRVLVLEGELDAAEAATLDAAINACSGDGLIRTALEEARARRRASRLCSIDRRTATS